MIPEKNNLEYTKMAVLSSDVGREPVLISALLAKFYQVDSTLTEASIMSLLKRNSDMIVRQNKTGRWEAVRPPVDQGVESVLIVPPVTFQLEDLYGLPEYESQVGDVFATTYQDLKNVVEVLPVARYLCYRNSMKKRFKITYYSGKTPVKTLREATRVLVEITATILLTPLVFLIQCQEDDAFTLMCKIIYMMQSNMTIEDGQLRVKVLPDHDYAAYYNAVIQKVRIGHAKLLPPPYVRETLFSYSQQIVIEHSVDIMVSGRVKITVVNTEKHIIKMQIESKGTNINQTTANVVATTTTTQVASTTMTTSVQSDAREIECVGRENPMEVWLDSDPGDLVEFPKPVVNRLISFRAVPFAIKEYVPRRCGSGQKIKMVNIVGMEAPDLIIRGPDYVMDYNSEAYSGEIYTMGPDERISHTYQGTGTISYYVAWRKTHRLFGVSIIVEAYKSAHPEGEIN